MKKLLFIVATHGDERSSVEVIRKIEKDLPHEKYHYDILLANAKAYKANRRFIVNDLNRIAPGNINSLDYEEKRAAKIVELSKNYSFAIDIHGSTSPCGIISIIPLPTSQNIALAELIGLPRQVIWYSRRSLTKGPLSQFLRCPSIEIEHGPMSNPDVVKELYNTIYKIVKKMNQKTYQTINSSSSEFYTVYGKLEGDTDHSFVDFQLKTVGDESFYPFLSNQYPGIICYKMKKETFLNHFIY